MHRHYTHTLLIKSRRTKVLRKSGSVKHDMKKGGRNVKKQRKRIKYSSADEIYRC